MSQPSCSGSTSISTTPMDMTGTHHIHSCRETGTVSATNQQVLFFRHSAGANEYLKSLSTTVKDHLMSKWLRTQQTWYKEDPKVRNSSYKLDQANVLGIVKSHLNVGHACTSRTCFSLILPAELFALLIYTKHKKMQHCVHCAAKTLHRCREARWLPLLSHFAFGISNRTNYQSKWHFIIR